MTLILWCTFFIVKILTELLNPHAIPLPENDISSVDEIGEKRGGIPRLLFESSQRQYDDEEKNKNLIVFYSFENQISGSSKVKDESGFDNNGIIDIGGMLLEIPGSTCNVAAYLWDQSLKITFSTPDGVPKNGFSISIWIKMLITEGERTVFKARGRRFGVITLMFYDKTAYFSYKSCFNCSEYFTVIAETNITHEWFHLAATYNATNGIAQLYINGMPLNRTWNKDFKPFQYWGNDVRIGGNQGHSSLRGFIDDLRIFNYALTSQENLNHYLFL
ncbi:hypothetical protein HZS_8043 [Henneguya salminicola]|nr:hypothetical protein HZS_8043 [Henneguya salminicola]